MRVRSRLVRLEDVTIYFILVGAAVVNVLLQPSFLDPANLTYTFETALPLSLASAGTALIILTAGIDLSVGYLVSLVTVAVALLAPAGIAIAFLVAIAIGVGAGALAGALVSFARLPSIIVTLGTSSLWLGIGLYVMPVPQAGIPEGLTDILGGPAPPLILVLMAVAWRWFRRTPAGLWIYAVGASERSAYAAGVPVQATRVVTFCLAGGLFGLSGLALVGITGGGDPQGAASFTLQSITAAVLGGVSFQGGKGSVVGAIAGALVLTLVTNIVFFSGATAFIQDIVYGALLIVALSISRLVTGRRVLLPMLGLAPRRSVNEVP